MTEFEDGFLRSVPRRPATVWQVAVIRLPVRISEEEGEPFHPEGALCLDLETNLVASSPLEREGTVEAAELVRNVLSRAVHSWDHLPGALQIADPSLAGALREELAGTGVAVEVEEELAALDSVFATLVESMVEREEPPPGILSGEGVTVEGAAAFARAARRFYEAAPWRFLDNEDLLRVEAPEMEAGLRDVVVMGAGALEYGLMFFSSPAHVEALERGEIRQGIGDGSWSVSFEDPEDAVPADLEAWKQHGFPTSEDDLIPIAGRYGEVFERPDARILAFFEGLLVALAETKEEEIDSGRWEKEVETREGPLRFVLALPGLLEERDLPMVPEGDPEELALELTEEAAESRGRRRILLARRALEIWPDCAEAYEILGDLAPDPERALDFYTQGMAAAERVLGPEVFEEHAGSFGDHFETQEYMSLRASVAETLAELDRPEEAVAHYEEMLRLDPDDSLGLLRYNLLDLLLELERYEQAEELLLRYPESQNVEWLYTRALLAFRREGEGSPEAQRRLREAVRRNRHVSDFLLGWRPLSDLPFPTHRPGSEAQASLYAAEALGLWESTPGALDWLDFWAPRFREAPKASKKGKAARKKKHEAPRRPKKKKKRRR